MCDYHKLVEDTRAVFNSGKTKTVAWRKSQLMAIVKMLEENEARFCQALFKDLHKHKMESIAMEINLSRSDAINALNNLEEWMKPEKVAKNLMTISDNSFIKREPFGVTLILGAWNYPVQLVMLPLIGAVAAGNCAIIKPSELCEETAVLLEEIVPKYLDTTCIHVVNGAVKETTALLQEKFDYIFYTGSSTVGKIIMSAAAKHLTPVTLELGGKSPVYVDKNTDIEVTSNRILWGKTMNAGQTCIAPDYIMCERSMQDKLINGLKSAMKTFFKDDVKGSDSYGRIVNERHFQRVKNLIDGGNIAIGGEMDEKTKFISPTVISDVKPSDKVMQEEIFGPVLPIMPVSGVDEAIDFINNRDKPLAMYIFTKDERVSQRFLDCTSSGGFCVNDTIVHAGNEFLPFGGVGSSGTGAYHGKFSFDTFSHKRGCVLKKQAMEKVNNIRYPPYSEKKLSWIVWAMKKNPKKGGIVGWLPLVIFVAALAVLFKMFVARQ